MREPERTGCLAASRMYTQLVFQFRFSGSGLQPMVPVPFCHSDPGELGYHRHGRGLRDPKPWTRSQSGASQAAL